MIELGKCYKLVVKYKSENPATGEITEHFCTPEYFIWTGAIDKRYGVSYKTMVDTDALVECGGNYDKLPFTAFWNASDKYMDKLIAEGQVFVEN